MGRQKKEYYNHDAQERKQKRIILDLNEQLEKEENVLKGIQTKKRNLGLQYFSKKKRKEIYDRAKQHGFSAEDLQRMEIFLDDEHWNQDEVSIAGGILELFQNAEIFLDENEHISMMSKVLSWLGDRVSEDVDNDN